MSSCACRSAAWLEDRSLDYAQPVPPTSRQAGRVVSESSVHIIRKTVRGAVAICGAGIVVQTLPGRFDPTEPGACQACALTLKPPQ